MSTYTPISLAYNVCEPENGTKENSSPIIFLHGMGGVKEMYGEIPQLVANKTSKKAYVVDQRNHGDAEWTESFNFDMLVDDLLHFMDTKNISKAILIGQSMGGVVAINTALRSPERVESIIVEDMYVKKLSKELLEMISSFMTMGIHLISQISADVSQEVAAECFVKQMCKVVPENMRGRLAKKENVEKFAKGMKRKEDGTWTSKNNYNALLRSLKDPDSLMSEPVGVFYGPACFVYGTLSNLQVGTHEDHIRKHFPKAKLIPFEGASHSVILDFPEELTEAFVNFVIKNQAS